MHIIFYSVSLILIIIVRANRSDYHHGTINMRTVLAKVNHDWEDEDVFKEFVNNCGVEAKTNETCINYYVCYAQKPLE